MAITPLIPSEKVRETYAKASDAQKDAFDAEPTTALILTLSKKHAVFADDLGKEVGYLILGLTSVVEFRSRLMQVSSDEKVVSEIIDTVTKGVLLPMRNAGSKKDPLPAPLPVKDQKVASEKVVVQLPPIAPPVRREPPRIPPIQKPAVVSATPSTPIVNPVAPVEKLLSVVPAPVQKPIITEPALPKPVPPIAKAPLSAPPVRPRMPIAPHKMRTMERDAMTAKGQPGSSLVKEVPPEKRPRPTVWEAAPVKTTPPEPQTPSPAKPAVDPYREPLE